MADKVRSSCHLYVPIDSGTCDWRCDVEGVINGDRLRVVVELPKEPPDPLAVTVIDVGG